jgi:molybdenum cofactor biosynthesis enzyme MoaA
LDGSLLRTTGGVCDACLADVPSRVVAGADGVVELVRDCPEHGPRRTVLSANGDGYARLDRAYHRLFPPAAPVPPREDTYFFVTNACNQDCPWCLTGANRAEPYQRYTRADFLAGLRDHRGSKVSLIGGEPTVDPDFFWYAETVGRDGRTLVVYTNGLALADEAFARRLAGVAPRLELRMTFEGFDATDYAHLGVAGVRERKLAALANLERLGMATTLGLTVGRRTPRDVMRRRIAALISYAAGHDFVRGLAFQGTRALGSARNEGQDGSLSVDEVMDRVIDAAPVRASRTQVYVTQKLIYVLARALRLPVCEYVQATVLLRRGRGGFASLDDLFDCERLDRALDRRIAAAGDGGPALVAGVAADLAACARLSGVPLMLRRGLEILPVFVGRWDFARIPRSVLPLLSITVCDAYIYDGDVARRCERSVHSRVREADVRELCSDMMIRHLREAAGGASAPRAGAGRVRPRARRRAG